MLKLTDFYYSLPPERIAKYPLPERSASRLLRLDRVTGAVEHQKITDLASLLSAKDLLIFNNTKVIPARLFGAKTTGGKVEILIERIMSDNQALAHLKGKALKRGTIIEIAVDATIEIVGREGNLFIIRFFQVDSILDFLQKNGHIPLPQYLERGDEELDKTRYQTLFAERDGAVAAPTAGLHFDEALLTKLKQEGIEFGFVTLHVGAGTFQPVRVENITEHLMHGEYAEVTEEVCLQIQACKQRGGRVVAVGTTSVRCLETAAQQETLQAFAGETRIFIYPGYQFRCVDALLTNFHLPKSTLLMLVSAFAGRENILRAYEEAIQHEYRFFSYGDAMLMI